MSWPYSQPNWNLLRESSIDQEVFVSISTPLGNNLVGESHYFGYQGGIRLFHEFYSAAAGSAVNLL